MQITNDMSTNGVKSTTATPATNPLAKKMEQALAQSAAEQQALSQSAAEQPMSEADAAMIDEALNNMIESVVQQMHVQTMQIIRSTKSDFSAIDL